LGLAANLLIILVLYLVLGKTKLITDYNYDFLVWGIISPWPIYRFVWLMNEALGINMHRIDDIEMKYEDGQPSYFTLYEYNNERDHYLLELIQNRIPNDLFVPELKTVDYLLLVKGELDFFDTRAFTGKIKKNKDGVHHVLEIGMDKLKSKHNLIFR